MYQGIIATPRGNPIFLHLIHQFVSVQKPIQHYFLSTDKFYYLVREDTNQQTLSPGVNAAYGDGDYSNLDVMGHSYAESNTIMNNNTSSTSSGSNITVSSSTVSSSSSSSSGSGVRRHRKFDYFLFEERKRPAKECYDGLDRHGKE